MNRSTTVGVQGQKGGHPVRDADTTPEISELERLRAENARLRAVLDAHGIDFQRSLAEPVAPQQSEVSRLSTDEKVALFRRLFQGRTDVYPVRWQSKAGKSGYSPACANEWRPGICEKPRIKCSDCGHRLLIPLSDQCGADAQHVSGRLQAIEMIQFLVSRLPTIDSLKPATAMIGDGISDGIQPFSAVRIPSHPRNLASAAH
ncbi:TOTE conflict system archaeo-eukaryotic primase domain-containing protein [Trinickia terrae]|uniref:TOTE conflict system archaeo-eukaryotic primase domain-containing protein n=1 Tax=Trinickia terrae TaxID=2571161 RepID=UPI001F0E907F|nr:hypothetical protein [Trinickia terrae]